MYEYNHEILTKEELLELVIKAKQGCKESMEEIITHNIRLVENEIKKYGFGDKEEYMQEGIIGLCEAVKKFDISKNVAFTTYAVFRIKRRLVYFVRGNRAIRIPHWVHDTKDLDMHKKRTGIISLNEIVADGIEKEELVGNNDSEIESIENRDILERLFSRLDKRERYVIEKSFSEKKSLVEISNELGVTKERVRQIKCSALNKLRKRSVEDGIKFRGFNRSTKTGTNETN